MRTVRIRRKDKTVRQWLFQVAQFLEVLMKTKLRRIREDNRNYITIMKAEKLGSDIAVGEMRRRKLSNELVIQDLKIEKAKRELGITDGYNPAEMDKL